MSQLKAAVVLSLPLIAAVVAWEGLLHAVVYLTEKPGNMDAELRGTLLTDEVMK